MLVAVINCSRNLPQLPLNNFLSQRNEVVVFDMYIKWYSSHLLEALIEPLET